MLKKYLSLLICLFFFVSCKEEVRTQKNSGDEFKDAKYEENMKSMVLVPGGTFIMGTDSESQKDQPVRSGAEEWPPHNVILKSFYMDKTEVTNAQFKEFVVKLGTLPLLSALLKKKIIQKQSLKISFLQLSSWPLLKLMWILNLSLIGLGGN